MFRCADSPEDLESFRAKIGHFLPPCHIIYYDIEFDINLIFDHINKISYTLVLKAGMCMVGMVGHLDTLAMLSRTFSISNINFIT